jgi:hypothetical protein
MTISSYSTLVDKLVELTEDDGTEFATYIPTAIQLAEERLVRENDFPELESSTTRTITTGSPDPQLPDSWDYINYVFITLPSGERKLLKRKQDDYLIDYWPNLSIQEEPKYYALDGNTNKLKVVPPADQTYQCTIRSFNTPTKLSASNPVNYFITDCPELLLNACMIECVKFLKMWGQIDIWEGQYHRTRQGWNSQAQRMRRDDGETPHNPDGGQNTFAHTEISNSTS